MSPFHTLAHVLVALPNKRTLCILVKLSMGTKIINTSAVIDCSTTGNFIDNELLSQANFPLQWLKRPVKAYNIDGTTSFKGNIIWEIQVKIHFPKLQETVDLLSPEWWQIILEMPWLHKWNSQVEIPWPFPEPSCPVMLCLLVSASL